MNPTLDPIVPELEGALESNVQIIADVSREDFFNIITEDAWYYVHVFGNAIYLVEYLQLAKQPVPSECSDKSLQPKTPLKRAHVFSG